MTDNELSRYRCALSVFFIGYMAFMGWFGALELIDLRDSMDAVECELKYEGTP